MVVPDNLKSGVNHASFYDPEISRSYGMMAFPLRRGRSSGTAKKASG
ncbi:hypothetical protein WGT02_30905 (plasmid) [Rhizobium sp. T1470]|nr:hypothetical protein [Rhizobium sp. T1473]MCA0806010.1 hypothetical protein [Rhizobium sp. T1473]